MSYNCIEIDVLLTRSQCKLYGLTIRFYNVEQHINFNYNNRSKSFKKSLKHSPGRA